MHTGQMCLYHLPKPADLPRKPQGKPRSCCEHWRGCFACGPVSADLRCGAWCLVYTTMVYSCCTCQHKVLVNMVLFAKDNGVPSSQVPQMLAMWPCSIACPPVWMLYCTSCTNCYWCSASLVCLANSVQLKHHHVQHGQGAHCPYWRTEGEASL